MRASVQICVNWRALALLLFYRELDIVYSRKLFWEPFWVLFMNSPFWILIRLTERPVLFAKLKNILTAWAYRMPDTSQKYELSKLNLTFSRHLIDAANGKPISYKCKFKKSIKWKCSFEKTINCYSYTLQLIVFWNVLFYLIAFWNTPFLLVGFSLEGS